MSQLQWTHRMLGDPAELDDAPQQVAGAEAQAWANFAIFLPDWLPSGTRMGQQTLRREAPPGRVGDSTTGRTPWSTSNPAAFRFEVVGSGRRLRVKQFLYDWAFPALDHPALWQSHTSADQLGEHHIVWHGVDYMGHRGASARIARTMIELSVLDGDFTRDEITSLYRSLHPVDDEAVAAIAATPFAVLSYWARRPDAATIAVPLGLWNLRQGETATITWHVAQDAQPVPATVPERLGGLVLDSFATHHGQSTVAAEYVYSGSIDRGRELRLHALAAESMDEMIRPDRHPARHESVEVARCQVRLASIEDAHGPFDAVIEDADGRPAWRLLSSADAHSDRGRFMRALGDLLSHSASGGHVA